MKNEIEGLEHRWMTDGVAMAKNREWESEGRTFILAVESAMITKEEIIRLAESIP
jgi:hypothetical protein